jgi:hypothetical protein
MTELKLQIPSSKLQRNSKHQASSSAFVRKFWSFGAWSFSGAWMLVLGIFKSTP